MMSRVMLYALGAMLLAGCANGKISSAEVSYHDFRLATDPAPLVATLRGLDVRAPSWLSSTNMSYRLSYVDGSRRQVYAESRWVATPAELLETGLRRRLLMRVATETGCRLRIDLDEFIQTFDAPKQSRVLLEARLSLLPARSDVAIARQALSLSQPSATPDARGGVAAFAVAVQTLAHETAAWLDLQFKTMPTVQAQCGGSGG